MSHSAKWGISVEGVANRNELAAKFFGRRYRHEAAWDRIHPDDEARVRRAVGKAIRERIPLSIEYRVKCFDDRYHRVRLTGDPQDDGSYGGEMVLIEARSNMTVRLDRVHPASPLIVRAKDK